MNKLIRAVSLSQLLLIFVALNLRAADTPKDADNTARNESDRNHAEVTPPDQGNSSADVATTKHIRQAIVAQKSLSTDAHNVKVITLNGHVTLRGPVKSSEEKRIIGELAAQQVTPANVANQLEVEMKN
jgi:osmotically-inducible protein OsmY